MKVKYFPTYVCSLILTWPKFSIGYNNVHYRYVIGELRPNPLHIHVKTINPLGIKYTRYFRNSKAFEVYSDTTLIKIAIDSEYLY